MPKPLSREDETLKRMLSTPPKQYSEMKARKPKTSRAKASNRRKAAKKA